MLLKGQEMSHYSSPLSITKAGSLLCTCERKIERLILGEKNPEDFAFLFEEISIITHVYVSANIAESWGDYECKLLKVKILMF